jgi:hypothetical protein
MSRVVSIAAAIAIAASAAGCGGGGDGETGAVTAPPAACEPSPRPERQVEIVEPARCPETAGPGCRSASGRIVFVEPVDPDGDGDAHFVIVDPQSITLPGFTAIDVRAGLRPSPLPGFGELIAAAGPVQTGSHGQSQIHALAVHAGEPAGD